MVSFPARRAWDFVERGSAAADDFLDDLADALALRAPTMFGTLWLRAMSARW